MEHPKELLDAFAEEIAAVVKELEPIVQNIRTKYTDAPNYAKFGQIIDRVYGTAATLGYKEIAEYCREMKALTYKCSQSTTPYGMGDVRDLVVVAIPLLNKMLAAIHDPNQIKKIQYTLQKERQKAEDLGRKAFGMIKRTSTAA